MNENILSAFAAEPLSPAVRKTLSNTFLTLAAVWAVTAVAGLASVALIPVETFKESGFIWGWFAATLVALFAVFWQRKTAWGLVALAVFAGLEGVTLGPVVALQLATEGGGQAVGMAGLLTAAATFACSQYVMRTRKDFSRWSGFLFAALVVFLLASIIAMFYPAAWLSVALGAAGAMLFTAYILYDVSRIVTGEEDNYIVAAVSIYLDMLNLFLSLLRLLSGNKD
ncbi:Bax inhibitor-1 family protein [Ramlibacter alkalitolerans]|uniref:Bax inhibitor-1 family protein n=1 Tax=Ramlibacter alkalitolerans TaxID=2039631 RepID=A0ABS1JUB7_9BURK|nr:Bax inhibitor-1 family protein [Ramlibacter alkalitolerans]MBL0427721.1 Bax inhibitor-1 family protein [Ramlibacter alkalitolerans]